MLLSLTSLLPTLATPALDQAEIDKAALRELARGGRAAVVQNDAESENKLHRPEFVVKGEGRDSLIPVGPIREKLYKIIQKSSQKRLAKNPKLLERLIWKLRKAEWDNCEGAAEEYLNKINQLEKANLLQEGQLEKYLLEDQKNEKIGIEAPDILQKIDGNFEKAVQNGDITPPQALPEIEPNA